MACDYFSIAFWSGNSKFGTIFEFNPGGKLTALQSFAGTDGANPYAGLIQATNWDFYWTTESGGTDGDGTVFKIAPGGRCGEGQECLSRTPSCTNLFSHEFASPKPQPVASCQHDSV